jgi:hypothetical protein
MSLVERPLARLPGLGDAFSLPDLRTSGRRLADATGGALTNALGSDTVSFPRPPGAPFSLPEPASALAGAAEQVSGLAGEAVDRASGLASQAAGAVESAAASVPGALAPAVAQAAGAAAQVEEIYEQVVERLRRDVLAERERMSDLIGDLT